MMNRSYHPKPPPRTSRLFLAVLGALTIAACSSSSGTGAGGSGDGGEAGTEPRCGNDVIDVRVEGSTPGEPANILILEQQDRATLYGLQYPVAAQSTYTFTSFPTYVLIDTTMTVSEVIIGFGGDELLSERIDALLP